MNVITPIKITDTILLSSTVPETVAATYSGVATYGLGDLAGLASVYGLAQIVYRSLQAGNTGHAQNDPLWWQVAGTVYPVYASGSSCPLLGTVTDLANHDLYLSLVAANTGNPLYDTTKWRLIGKTNRWAMFDRVRNTTTTVPKSMTYVISPGIRADTLALMGLVNVDTVVVTGTSSGTPVYSHTENLDTREVLGFYDYFFEPFSTRPNILLLDIPPISNLILTITLSTTLAGEDIGIGASVSGSAEYIGLVQYDAESDELNFSTITREFDGSVSQLTPRASVPKNAHTLFVEKKYVNRIRALRKALGGVAAVYAGLDDSSHDYFDAILIYGVHKRFSISLAHPTHATINLEVEEL